MGLTASDGLVWSYMNKLEGNTPSSPLLSPNIGERGRISVIEVLAGEVVSVPFYYKLTNS